MSQGVFRIGTTKPEGGYPATEEDPRMLLHESKLLHQMGILIPACASLAQAQNRVHSTCSDFLKLLGIVEKDTDDWNAISQDSRFFVLLSALDFTIQTNISMILLTSTSVIFKRIITIKENYKP
jgi:hypothetical protein